MPVARKKPPARYRCVAAGISLTTIARSVGGDAKRLRRLMARSGKMMQTEKETGGWKGVSIECLGRVALLVALLALVGCRPVGPKPKPTPDSDPPGNAMSVVIVYDAAKETPQAAAVYSSPALRDYCRVNGHELRVIESGVIDETGKAPKFLAPYLEAAVGKLPALVLGRDGKVRQTYPLPASDQLVIDAINRTTGAAADADTSIWAGGARRYLALPVAAPGLEKRWPVEGARDEPLIPRESWADCDFASLVPAIQDQDGYSCCAACAATGAIRTAKARAGFDDRELSVVDLYDRVNGGRDRGASLESVLTEVTSRGVCSTQYAPMWGVRNPKRSSGYQTDRARHRVLVAQLCPSAEHVGSAIQRRRPVVFGTMVTDRFSPDKGGLIGPARGAPRGGHAMFLAGAKRINGEWYFHVINSWGEDWGDKGRAWIHESWVDPRYGCWSIASVAYPSDQKLAAARRPPVFGGLLADRNGLLDVPAPAAFFSLAD